LLISAGFSLLAVGELDPGEVEWPAAGTASASSNSPAALSSVVAMAADPATSMAIRGEIATTPASRMG
jgi:hypothetical protein